MEDKRKIEIRSDEVQEILSHVPSWMIRWGITLIFILILLGLLLSHIVKYPDVIKGQVILTTEQPPSRLVSQANGNLKNLLIENDSIVSKGEIIAEIRSPISKSSLDSLAFLLNNNHDSLPLLQIASLKQLGGLQIEVNQLIAAATDYQNLTQNGYYEQNIANLEDQIKYNHRLAWISKRELKLLEAEIFNAKDKYLADSALFAEQVIAKHTFYANQSEFRSKQQQQINAKKNYVQFQITATNFKKQKIELINNFKTQLRQLETSMSNTKKAIKSAISSWEQTYALTAPQSGRLSYLSNLSEGMYVQAQQELFAIIPKDEQVVAIANITDQAFGKIQTGQKVHMKFTNYPYQEFGQLLGRVTAISKIPTEQGYFVSIKLQNGLTTTYHRQLAYQAEMSGSAEVITEDLSLLERIVNNFRRILDR